ncbi:MAG: YbaB/EbfC family nucleoid-associated protein [Bacteroidota bacterium]
MFGNFQEQQEKMEAQLREIIVHGAAGGGAVKVTATGAQEVTDISIDKDKIDLTDVEQLEDLVLLAVEDALNQAKEQAAAASQNMLKEMLPPGMGNLGSLFGQ